MQQQVNLLSGTGTHAQRTERRTEPNDDQNDFQSAFDRAQQNKIASEKKADRADHRDEKNETVKKQSLNKTDDSEKTPAPEKNVSDDADTAVAAASPSTSVEANETSSSEINPVLVEQTTTSEQSATTEDTDVTDSALAEDLNPMGAVLSPGASEQKNTALSASETAQLGSAKQNQSELLRASVSNDEAAKTLQQAVKDASASGNHSQQNGLQTAIQAQPFSLEKGKLQAAASFSLDTEFSLNSGLSHSGSEKEGSAAAVMNHASQSFNLSPSNSRIEMPVNITFGKPQWAGMVAERAAMMAAQNISSAELQLDPPELGPLQVKVQVHQDQVSVSFVASNAGVKDALDQTALRLRDMCEQQGMNLAEVSVSDQSQQESAANQGDGDGTDGHRRNSNGTDNEPSGVDSAVQKTTRVQAGWGVDFYA